MPDILHVSNLNACHYAKSQLRRIIVSSSDPNGPYPVELEAPDIGAHEKGNTPYPFVSTFDSGKPGPHVCVNAVTHGNEICGAIVVDRLLRDEVRPVAGRLSFVFNNYAAYQQFDPSNPDASRFVDEDFNRVWTLERLEGPDDSSELRRAREMRPFYDTVDLMLDIHSMGTRSPALMICNGLEKERVFTRKMNFPAHITCGSGHVVGARLLEYPPFQDPDNGKVALLVECGQHWAKETGVAAMDTACHFLVAAGAVEAHTVAPYFSPHGSEPPPALMWDVTDGIISLTDTFEFVQVFNGMEVIEKAGTVIATDGDHEHRTPYDNCMLMMPNYKPGAGQRKLRLCRRVG